MNTTKLTAKVLKSWEPCENGYIWYKKNCLEKGIDDTAKILRLLIKSDKLDWADWTVARALDRPNRIRYTIFAAEQVIDIYEAEYPNDPRPRNAINAAKAVLENDTKENRTVAANAANDAAHTAAYTATYAAAYAATNDAANAAANAAANVTAYAVKIKILNYGIKLLEKK